LQQVCLSGVIGSIRAYTSHRDAERIERLSQRTEKHPFVQLAEVGFEQEFYAPFGSGQQARRHHNDQQQDEERGHHQFGGFLNATPYAMNDDIMSEQQYGRQPENRPYGVCRECLEIALYIVGIAMKLTHDRRVDILQAPSRHHSVIACDEKSGNHAEQPHILPRLATTHLGVCPVGVGRSMSPDDKLSNHARNAQQQYTCHIYQDECRATVLAGHVWKAPHVTQSHRAAGSGQDHTQLASKARSFFRHIRIFIDLVAKV